MDTCAQNETRTQSHHHTELDASSGNSPKNDEAALLRCGEKLPGLPSAMRDGLPCTSSAASSATTVPASVRGSPKSNPVAIQLRSRIGKGSFGEVYEGRIGSEHVAVKRVQLDPEYLNRELSMMQLLTEHQHPNVVTLKGFHQQHERKCGQEVCYMAMELFPMCLSDRIEQWARNSRGSSSWEIKLYSYHFARGLEHIHGLGICHRDLKPQNVLVNPSTGSLKICDFGTAKVMEERARHTTYITTRFYRAPECLLENEQYTHSIDVWAMGCVVAEMVKLRPVFAGSDNTDQLYLLFRAKGTPAVEDFEGLNPALEPAVITELLRKPRAATSWQQLLKQKRISNNLENLLDGLLHWSPTVRPRASEITDHPYFDKIGAITSKFQGQDPACSACQRTAVTADSSQIVRRNNDCDRQSSMN